ncbi:MAG: tRNA-dihydrouridine synthase family protein [Oscillospiraceae bacterium]|nr:tRNA-dihydrouridine synthase family protein [Oscillospiraceae bacterium]
MEGLTDSIYRRIHHKYFPGVDRYYMPFISPTIHRSLTHKEDRELPLAESEDFTAIPQVLTKVPEDFLWAARVCADRGYSEVNLNAGCPSGTVVSKGKGSGMLRNPDELDRFLDAVFSDSPLPISVKTRLGLETAEDFVKILEVFNRYPITELTVHPRVRKDFYKEPVREEWFRYAYENSKMKLCYNGNIITRQQADSIAVTYPGVESVMIGRALIGDPGMLSPEGTGREQLKQFHDELVEEYTRVFGSQRNAMFRMKENWSLLHKRFEDTDRLWKKLRKTTDYREFMAISNEIFRTLPLAQALRADW